MKQDILGAYKKAIQQQFEKEKSGLYSSHLLQSSRAKLRQLCVERFKGNSQLNDLNTFKVFFGFEFGEGNLNKLKSETDKFRPIENFFKGITDTNDIATIDLAAILVDFNPRPYLKFGKDYSVDESSVDKIVQTIVDLDGKKAEDFVAFSRGKKKRNIALGVLSIVALFCGCYITKGIILPEKQCMQWQNDHYELMDCNSEMKNFSASSDIKPIDKDDLEVNKINVCDTTTFFKGGKAAVWYCKVNGVPEFFDDLGSGFHPVTGNTLRPVTQYIIKKYVPRCK